MIDARITHHIAFIQKGQDSQADAEGHEASTEAARKGKNPSPEVVKWADTKAAALERQIAELNPLQVSTKDVEQICQKSLRRL